MEINLIFERLHLLTLPFIAVLSVFGVFCLGIQILNYVRRLSRQSEPEGPDHYVYLELQAAHIVLLLELFSTTTSSAIS